MVICLIIGICCCCRNRKKDKDTYDNSKQYKKGNPTAVNMEGRNDATLASNASYDFKNPRSYDHRNNGNYLDQNIFILIKIILV